MTDKSQQAGFDGWVKIIFLAGMLVFAFHASTHMVAAGDTWVAMACGRHYANHPVDTVEPFSANSHKPGPTKAEIATWPKAAQSIANKFDIETVRKWHPTGWINQNWLTHLIFYKLATFGQEPGVYNYNALVWWKFTIYFIAAFCVYYTGRLMGVSVPGAALASAMAMFIGRTFLDIRPAGYANLLVAVYIMVLALTVYKNYLWIWLAVPITVFWANVHGGYIYVFIMMVPFVGLNLISIPFKKRFTSIGLKGIYHTIGAGLTSLVAMILFNPYKLTNLTHTFEISISKHAESWRKVNEWHRAFEWNNPVGDEIPFTVMFVIAWIALAIWFVVWAFMKPSPDGKRGKRSNAPVEPKPGEYVWPLVNLAAIFIAAMTVYMAVRSRRFIPLGGIAACPVIVLFIEQSIAMIVVKFNSRPNGDNRLPSMPESVRKGIIGIGCFVLLGFGSVWGAKYHKIYLAPWPIDSSAEYNPEKRDSVFMRMTASNVKPFDVCQFIRDNNLKGNMFNYWTEGGALAFGQTPDLETGKTPLQLFMDGRAQAAYNHDKFLLWQFYYAGGDNTIPARIGNRFATNKEKREIGNWLDEKMKNAKIWVFVLPNSQFVKPSDPRLVNYFPLVLPNRSNWKLAYVDDYQQLFVDVDDPRGLELVNSILNGKAVFPNEYIEKITTARLYLQYPTNKRLAQGYDVAKEALEMNLSQMSMATFTHYATNLRPAKAEAVDFIKELVSQITLEADSNERISGEAKHLVAGIIGSNFLSMHYTNTDKTISRDYKKLSKKFENERREISEISRW